MGTQNRPAARVKQRRRERERENNMSSLPRNVSRQVTPDGRNSLRSHLFGGRGQSVVGLWTKKILRRETYPLLACVGFAIVGTAWFSQRHLFQNPDVQVSKLARKQTIRENTEDGKKWMKHRDSLANTVKYVKKDSPPPAA